MIFMRLLLDVADYCLELHPLLLRVLDHLRLQQVVRRLLWAFRTHVMRLRHARELLVLLDHLLVHVLQALDFLRLGL